MHKLYKWLSKVGILFLGMNFSFCGKGRMNASFLQVDSLNLRAYSYRYKDLDVSEQMAKEAYLLAENYPAGKAQALNHLGFCRFMKMDFEQSDSLFRVVYETTSNELELLVADVSMMKICQRTAQNKEFYDYRNSALRRIYRFREDEDILKNPNIRNRFIYAQSEFYITSSVYYYYLQQSKQAKDAINEVQMDDGIAKDEAQLLYYYYMKGSGGLCEAETAELVLLEEFDYLYDCLVLSHEQGYVYFEANALQALAEMFKDKESYDWLLQQRPGMMRSINQQDLAWEDLSISLAGRALELFLAYGDWYQIAVINRTLASCYAELGQYEKSLAYLTEALSYVNKHHETYYHCADTLDRLRPYIPMATNSIELQWINQEGIMTVPEWIAGFREQLSVTYSALGLKPQSDYNRNIYLDILDYTRQDKELENRYSALQAEMFQLNVLFSLVVLILLVLIVLMWLLNRRWRLRNAIYINKLKEVLEICRTITISIPDGAEDIQMIIDAVWTEVRTRLLVLVKATAMEIVMEGESANHNEGYQQMIPLKSSDNTMLGKWVVYSKTPMRKEDRVLLQIIAPYISWTLENGWQMMSLTDEYSRLEKEKYVHEQHLAENKRQNIVKKACFFIVLSIMPYIDRVVNEVRKLIAFNYLSDSEVKLKKFQYIDELVSCINEYNDILALWIKMKQGSLNLNVENFELEPLFEVIRKGKKNFEVKSQDLQVSPTKTVVKADKALTLFMINTLAENARKYTQSGGRIEVFAVEEKDYVEISIKDNGPGLSPEDVRHILDEKVYDSGSIGVQTAADADELKKNKGSGFGLMNCKGIIEKYRKTNTLFQVCGFYIDTQLGKGSRFYFRLPKGVRRVVYGLLLLLIPVITSCKHYSPEKIEIDLAVTDVDTLLQNEWVNEANRLANKVYEANISGNYQDALNYADSAFTCLNNHYKEQTEESFPLLSLAGNGEAAELQWFDNHFYTDYHTLLDIRNEVAVACLALGLFDVYQYNNQAYTSLYKQISVDVSLEKYCEQMQQSANHKVVSIALCVVLLLVLLLGYYMFYIRQRLNYRYNLEQVFEVNKQAFSLPLFSMREDSEIASALVSGLCKEMNELVTMDVLSLAIYNEDTQKLAFAFSSPDEQEDELKETMSVCFQTKDSVTDKQKRIRSFPLCIRFGGQEQCLGVMAYRYVYQTEREEEDLLLKLVTDYISIIVYNAVKLFVQKYRDIEIGQDEVRRVIREESMLHVQNLVLDNCLSTIKHETVYYPNKIKSIIDKLNESLSEPEERQKVESISDLVGYYKDIYTTLSAWASRQLEEVTFRRTTVSAKDLAAYASRYFKRLVNKAGIHIDLVVHVADVYMVGDVTLLKYLLENLIAEALAFKQEGVLELSIYKVDTFVRFDFRDSRRSYTVEELSLLFYPRLSRMKSGGQEGVVGTEYLICKQIIREHDEYSGRRGCRMNAEVHPEGGFVVWCTIPAK